MRRQRHQHQKLRSEVGQLDLFGRPRVASHPSAPAWDALPEETRRTLTALIARLLLEHSGGSRHAQPAGGRGDV